MIKLTSWDGEPIYVAPEQIRTIERDPERPSRTRVYFMAAEVCRTVLESPEEVARKVMDCRLFMEQYRACEHLGRLEDAGYIRWDLMKLAGLDDVDDSGKEKSTAGTVE